MALDALLLALAFCVFLAAVPAADAKGLCKVLKANVASVTLKSGPCSTFPTLATVTAAAAHTLFFVNDTYTRYSCETTSTWASVRFHTRGGAAFVSTAYLAACDGAAASATCRKTTGSLNVRVVPCTTGNTPVAMLSEGTQVELLGWTGDMNTACADSTEWYRITYLGGAAYVDGSKLEDCGGSNQRLTYDRTRFFEAFNATWGALTSASKKTGLEYILNGVEADPNITDIRWFAYMLATAKLEVGDTWQPIEEWGKGEGHEYGEPVTVTDENGVSYTNVYYGRGYVQLTWEFNYRKMGKKLHNRMLYEPELALVPSIAFRVMSVGMIAGDFTGRSLGNYIPSVNSSACDYYNCRRIINGISSAEKIAGYAEKFEDILRYANVWPGDDVPPAGSRSGGGGGDDNEDGQANGAVATAAATALSACLAIAATQL